MVREIDWSHNIMIMESKSNLQTFEKSQTASVKSETKFRKTKISGRRYVNNELKRTRTNSNCMSSFQFVPVRCLNYLTNRTRMTRIARIFTDPCASVSSAQSVFHPKNPNNHISVSISVHPQSNESNQSPQKAHSIATIIFASFALFAVRFINSLSKLSSIAVPSAFIDVHPQLIDRTAPAEG
jgi:hypothetical protein